MTTYIFETATERMELVLHKSEAELDGEGITKLEALGILKAMNKLGIIATIVNDSDGEQDGEREHKEAGL